MSNGKKSSANFRAWLFDAWSVHLGDMVFVTSCQECGIQLTLGTMSVDHYPIPACLGGRYHKNNARPLCANCNHTDGVAIGRMDRDELVALTRLRMVSPQYLAKMVDLKLQPVTLASIDKQWRQMGLDVKVSVTMNGIKRKYP